MLVALDRTGAEAPCGTRRRYAISEFHCREIDSFLRKDKKQIGFSERDGILGSDRRQCADLIGQ